MEPDELDRICQSLPVFPLPRTALMPGEMLPLHVFEPRYRALVRHCLEGDGVFGIATLRPGYEAAYHGAPPIWPEVGVGRVARHQAFPDGRYNLVLASIGRMLVERELAGDLPYRRVAGRPVRDDLAGARAPLDRLRVLVMQLGTVSPEAAREARRLVALDGVEMVDALARRLIAEPDARRAYLATARVADRVAEVERRLARFMRVTTPAAEA